MANRINSGNIKKSNGVSQDTYGNLQDVDRFGGVVPSSVDFGSGGDSHIRGDTFIPCATPTEESSSNHDSHDSHST